MIDQETIDRFRQKQGTSPAFQKEISELFKKPVISIQIPSNTSKKERSEVKPNNEINKGR